MSRIFQKSPFNYEYKVGVYNAADYNPNQNLATGVVNNQLLSSALVVGGAYVRDGQEIHIYAAGRSGGTGSKTLRLRLNTLTLAQATAITPTNNTGWTFEAILRRISSTVLYKTVKFFYNLGETPGMGVATTIGTSGSMTPGFDIGAVDLTFDVHVDVAVASETLRQDYMSVAIL